MDGLDVCVGQFLPDTLYSIQQWITAHQSCPRPEPVSLRIMDHFDEMFRSTSNVDYIYINTHVNIYIIIYC